MTRRDQILRAWIERESTTKPWVSVISFKGRLHRKTTNTKLRKAARDFAALHLVEFLSPKASPTAEDAVQLELLHPDPSS